MFILPVTEIQTTLYLP